MTIVFSPPELVGSLVRLEPLRAAHVAGLALAAGEDRSSYRFTSVPQPDEMGAYVDAALAARTEGDLAPFAQVRRADDQVVGVTCFVRFRVRSNSTNPWAVEIGGTWLAASAQRTGINRDAKLLLLGFAFDVWGTTRVDFTTDARNERSRAAIAALGARFEGVLRSWGPSRVVGEEEILRDTAIFSITEPEWPDVRVALKARLG